MRLIDTHCHLADDRLRGRVGEVLARARDAGVVACICAAGDLAETRAALALAEAHECVRFTAGIHPHQAKDADDEALRQIAELTGRQGCAALGEIGLDFHYDFSPRHRQRAAFAAQLDLARSIDKPVVIHMRDALAETLAIVRQSGCHGERLVFHSFSGGPDAAGKVLDLGAAVSFSGMATFKNAGQLRRTVALTPDDRILIETDSPYLSPEPVRRMQINEPANVVHVARCLAEVRGVGAAALAELSAANAVRLFGLDMPQ